MVGLVDSSSTVGQRDTFNFVPIRSIKGWLSADIPLPFTTAEGHKSGGKEKPNDQHKTTGLLDKAVENYGSVFVVLLLVFLVAAFFLRDRLTENWQQILRFICAICAGVCGGVITREALFSWDTGISINSILFISWSAGFALFCTVCFTFAIVPPDAFHFSLPSGWTFKDAADAIAAQDQMLVEFIGFTSTELQASLKPKELRVKDTRAALGSLRLLAASSRVRAYEVEHAPPVYRLTVRT